MMQLAAFTRKNVIPLLRVSSISQQVQTASLSSLVKLEERQGYAIVTMQKAPVNSLCLELIQALSDSLNQLEKNNCKGFILASALPSVFCAGLDIREMYKSPEERFRKFWSSFQKLWLQLYGSKMASVALINGHAPAGGCVLAMCCDSRIMVSGKSKIGLNESKVGIVAPYWVKDTFVNTIGVRQAERGLQLGTLYSVEEANNIGLVDKVAPDLETATAIAEADLEELLQVPAVPRYLSKMKIRENVLKGLSVDLEADADLFINFAMSESVQVVMGKYLDSLAQKN